ncbi:MAG: TonB-dependent receptor [Sphingomonadaceae bacterium]
MTRLAAASLVAMAAAMAQPAAALADDTAPADGSNAAAADPQARATGAAGRGDGDIVVTGTRRTDRTLLDSPVPVDVFTRDDFKAVPAAQLQSVLKTLVPSFNQQRNLLGDASAFVRPPTLRGLPADQILVLVNGKRRHRSALVQVAGGALNAGAHGPDISQISVAAVERIEVLRDGASAQYGSDAIAGVINIGLTRNSEGFLANAQFGQSYRGDGDDVQVSAGWGTRLGTEGFFNLTAEFIDQGIFDRSVERPEIEPLRRAGIVTDFPTGNRLGGVDTRAYRLVFNAEIPLDEVAVYAFGNWGWQRQGIDFNLRRPIGVTALEPIPGRPGTANLSRSVNPVFLDRVGVAPDGTPLWDINGRTWNANTELPGFANGFVPFFGSTNEDASIVGGVRGTIIGFGYDLSLAAGLSKIRYTLKDTLNASLGPATPTEFYLGKFVQREINFNADFTRDLDLGLAKPALLAFGLEVRRESFEVGLGDRASWEVGPFASQWLAECRLGGVAVRCGTPGASAPVPLLTATGARRVATALPGANGFQGFSPDSVVQGGRNNYSGYVDVEADLAATLQVGAALRYDYFDDFGGTLNGKLTGRFALTEALALRASASTGFKAPTPGQQFTQNLTTGFPFGSVVPLGVLNARVDSLIGRYYLAEDLTPEKSVNVSAGLVVQPGFGLTATIDYYDIRVRDRIALTGNINPAPDRADLVARGVPGAEELGAVRYFTNAFRTRTRGVDIVLIQSGETPLGALRNNLAINYNRTLVTDRRTITGTLPSGRTISLSPIDDVRVGNIENSVPRWRGTFTSTLQADPIDATIRVNYFGSFSTFFDPITGGFGPTPGSGILTVEQARALYPNPWPRRFGAQASLDLEFGVTIRERFRLAAGAENLLNTFPERETRNIFPTTGGLVNGAIYPDVAPIGWMGGFWYVRGSMRF